MRFLADPEGLVLGGSTLKRLALILLFTLPSGCTPITASTDVSGLWVLKQEKDFRGNPSPPVECTFKQQGGALTVKCGNGNVLKGKVRGRNVTWGFEKTGIPPMIEDRLVLVYTAELNESATALKGAWHLFSEVVDEKGPFEAQKRQQSIK